MSRTVVLDFDDDRDAERFIAHIKENAVNTEGVAIDNDFVACTLTGVYREIYAIEGKE